eukprot:657764-Pyramimonas_sp.AAC.1
MDIAMRGLSIGAAALPDWPRQGFRCWRALLSRPRKDGLELARARKRTGEQWRCEALQRGPRGFGG